MIYTDASRKPVLTYVTDIEYLANSGYKKEKIFVDANNGALVNSYTVMQSAFNYSIHSIDNQCLSQNSSALPGNEITKDDGEHAVASAYRASSSYNSWRYPAQNSTDESSSYWVSQNIYNPNNEALTLHFKFRLCSRFTKRSYG